MAVIPHDNALSGLRHTNTLRDPYWYLATYVSDRLVAIRDRRAPAAVCDDGTISDEYTGGIRTEVNELFGYIDGELPVDKDMRGALPALRELRNHIVARLDEAIRVYEGCADIVDMLDEEGKNETK